MTGEWGAIRKADYSRAWGIDSTELVEYDYYLRAKSQFNLFTKEGLERSAEISQKGLQLFPNSPLLTVELVTIGCLALGLPWRHRQNRPSAFICSSVVTTELTAQNGQTPTNVPHGMRTGTDNLPLNAYSVPRP